MNCKINILWGVKISYFVHTLRHSALLYFENTLKLFMRLLIGVGITAIRKLCRPDRHCFFFQHGVDLPRPL